VHGFVIGRVREQDIACDMAGIIPVMSDKAKL
jgi:hypothetical protein